MLAEKNSYIEDAVVTLHQMTDDEKIREQCRGREKYNWDMASAIEKGRREGLSEGLSQGSDLKLISMICRKLKKGKTPECIAEELDEETALVDKICTVAKKFAPEYDIERIYEALSL